jgi:hypothetical protein
LQLPAFSGAAASVLALLLLLVVLLLVLILPHQTSSAAAWQQEHPQCAFHHPASLPWHLQQTWHKQHQGGPLLCPRAQSGLLLLQTLLLLLVLLLLPLVRVSPLLRPRACSGLLLLQTPRARACGVAHPSAAAVQSCAFCCRVLCWNALPSQLLLLLLARQRLPLLLLRQLLLARQRLPLLLLLRLSRHLLMPPPEGAALPQQHPQQ